MSNRLNGKEDRNGYGLGGRLGCCLQDIGRKQPHGCGSAAGGLLCYRTEGYGMALQEGMI